MFVSHYVQECDDEFLSLFPHRYDYIWASHSDPRAPGKPDWKTESRHPLSDRLIQQGAYLYGVRFGPQTRYCLLDIDAGSLYHPSRDPLAFSRILAALETLGLVSPVVCTSSYSEGIHVYFPFDQSQKTWQVAIALETLLKNAGFAIALGQLEIFPNAKPYIASGEPTSYTAHRLPMQAGSYLLNQDWEKIHSHPTHFVERWKFACEQNSLDTTVLTRVIKLARQKQYGLSGKSNKFLDDLNTDIETGWTSHGQTNFILGRIALRSYVFGHVLYAPHPLEGRTLVEDIVRIARSLPGYQQWCRHQHEIEQRAEDWARCVESSHYFHFGFGNKRLVSTTTDSPSATTPTWNEQQKAGARERIRGAIANLLEQDRLPSGATERFRILLTYGIGGGSLYRHRDLWHPESLQQTLEVNSTATQPTATQPVESPLVESLLVESLPVESLSVESVPVESVPVESLSAKKWVSTSQSVAKNAPVENPPQPPVLLQCETGNCAEGASPVSSLVSLLVANAGNPLHSQELGDRYPTLSTPTGGNSSLKPLPAAPTTSEGFWEQRRQTQQTAYEQRLQRYLESNDPILIAEAQALNNSSLNYLGSGAAEGNDKKNGFNR